MNYRQAISPVVATALLLVVAVVAVVGFQTFFNAYSSGLFSKVETQSSNENMNTGINFVNDNSLYFNNANTNNITITSVKVDGVDCNISQELSLGMTEFDITVCTENLTTSTPEVVVYTTNKIYSEKYFSTNIISSVSSFINATGGTITYFGNYKIHNFTTNGTFNITSGSGTVEYLVVGGGGGGGRVGGGGGAGGVLNGTISLSLGTFSIIIGNGGIGATAGTDNGLNGGNSSFNNSLIAIGGGGGAGYFLGIPTAGNGGSGGGSYRGTTEGTGAVNGNGTSLQGYNGGIQYIGSTAYSGGGGGANSTGGASTLGNSGNGGSGTYSIISGVSLGYAGGGGGGSQFAGPYGNATEGGGAGGGFSASVNTGAGGGGGANTGAASGNGASGIVIVRYQYQ